MGITFLGASMNEKQKETLLGLVGLAVIILVVWGWHSIKEANKTPEQKAAEQAERDQSELRTLEVQISFTRLKLEGIQGLQRAGRSMPANLEKTLKDLRELEAKRDEINRRAFQAK
jgi:hypothetical protein